MITIIKNSKKNFFLMLILLSVMVGIVYFPIILQGNMYMYLDIGSDTYGSYWPSLAYCKGLLTDIKAWDTSLGLGASTIQQISYFMIDPFNWIVFLFDSYNMDWGLFISLLTKYFFLAVFSYCYLKKKNYTGWVQLIGTLSICFSGWFVGWGQHYNNASLFVFFICSLYFFECWLQDSKWLGFCISITIIAASSVFYCYIILLFMAFYYLAQRIEDITLSRIKSFLIHGMKTAGICLLGLGLSSILFIPAVRDLSNSPRTGANLVPTLLKFASMKEYFSLLCRLVSNTIIGINGDFMGYSNWYESPFMYIGIIAVFMAPLALRGKNRKKIVFTTALIFFSLFFLRFTAAIFNAFSYITYRWTLIFVPVGVCAICSGLSHWSKNQDKIGFNNKLLLIMYCLIFFSVYMGISQANTHKTVLISFFTVLAISTAFYIIFSNRTASSKIKVILLCAVCFTDLTLNSFYSVQYRSLVPRASKATMAYFDETFDLIDELEKTDDSFYRINKRYGYIDLNDSFFQKYRGEKYYSSILTSSYWEMQILFDLRTKYSNYFMGFDDKQVLRDINVGKYMLTKDDRRYYGYRQIDSGSSTYLYLNENCSGFGCLYDQYITASEFIKLDQISQQDLLYHTCVLEDGINLESVLYDKTHDPLEELPIQQIDYKRSAEESGEVLLLEKPNETMLILKLTNNTDYAYTGNAYISTINDGISSNDYVVVSVPAGETKIFNFITLDIDKIAFDVPLVNIDVEMYQKDMSGIEEVQHNKSCMNLDIWEDEHIKGRIRAGKSSILYLPIIYDDNWKIYINGELVSLLRANGGFSAVYIPTAGDYSVELLYISSSLKIGMIVSILAVLVICFCKFIYPQIRRATVCQNI